MKQRHPTPMNTVALLKVASKALGIGPRDTMRAAENLYLRGYLSYPRTESTAYPKSFDVRASLQTLVQHEEWGYYVAKILKDGYTKPKGGFDAGDHPPITPCRLAQSYELSGSESRIYDLVARHFVATASPDAVFNRTRVQFQSCGAAARESTGRGKVEGKRGEKENEKEESEKFTLTAKVLIDPGFLEIQRFRSQGGGGGGGDEEKKIPRFQKNEQIDIIGATKGGGGVGGGDGGGVAVAGAVLFFPTTGSPVAPVVLCLIWLYISLI